MQFEKLNSRIISIVPFLAIAAFESAFITSMNGNHVSKYCFPARKYLFANVTFHNLHQMSSRMYSVLATQRKLFPAFVATDDDKDNERKWNSFQLLMLLLT